MNDLVGIMCPPLADYPEQPKDMSKCELVDCPYCKNKMWFSEKKKMTKEVCEIMGKNIFIACYLCFINELQKMKDTNEINDLTEFKRVDL